MKFVYNDGGRAAAGYKVTDIDCICRSIAIVTKLPYKQVYNDINKFATNTEKLTVYKSKQSTAAANVFNNTIKKYIESLGGKWMPTMFIGQGCKVHLRAEELPLGKLIINVGKHITAVIDNVIYDDHDCSRGGMRCVYGYYIFE